MFVRVSVGKDWEAQELRFLSAPSWMPKIFKKRMDELSPYIVDKMRKAIEENRYTGALESGIQGSVEQSGDTTTLKVNSVAMRGSWDAGTLLEMGSRPHVAPWAPIAAWAKFRGLPAFPVWYKIKTEGADAHPFIERTLQESTGIIEYKAAEIGWDIAEAIVRSKYE